MAQMARQKTNILKVLGSIPSAGMNKWKYFILFLVGCFAVLLLKHAIIIGHRNREEGTLLSVIIHETGD